MTKRILILKGSPREKGNSSVLAEQVSAGAQETGTDAESIYLHSFETMFRFLGMKIDSMVYGTASDIGDVQKQPEFNGACL